MLGSLAVSSFIVLVPSIEFANLIGWVKGVVLGWGIPSIVWAFVSVFVAQMWMQWRNNKMVKSDFIAGGVSELDLY